MARALLLWVIGWLAGALVNLIADQMPLERRLHKPTCSHCGQPVGWTVYLFLEPCHFCAQPRSRRSFIVQWALPVLFALVDLWNVDYYAAWEALALAVFFALVLVIDLEHRLILHPISLAGAALCAFIGLHANGPTETLIGGAAGFGIMFLLYLLGELFARFIAWRRGETLDEVALGFGDVNLAGVLGLLLGWPGIAICLLFAVVAGGLISGGTILVMVLRKQYRAFTALPYAPFLVVAAAGLVFHP